MIVTRSTTFFFVFITILILNSCSGMQRVRPQVLQPDDQNLPDIEHRLVFFSIDIDQGQTKLKLHRLVAKNLSTQELWVFPFYDNAILGSSILPVKKDGNTIKHFVLLDIPAGRYQLTEADFKYFQYNIIGSNTSQKLNHKLTTSVFFDVTENEASYLGNLNIRIVTPNLQSSEDDVYTQLANDQGLQQTYPSMTIAALNAAKTTIQTLGGFVYFNAPGIRGDDIPEARELYPTLSNVRFSQGRIWTE